MDPNREDDIYASIFGTETRTPDTDISSSDHDTPVSTSNLSKSRARAKKVPKSNQESSSGTPSLRPAKDILSRIRHDPTLNEGEYIIGYLDRHLPEPVEMDVSDWRGGGDVTEEEWIPQHRILYFRRKGEEEGRKVWDREKRLDRLFGSGLPESKASSPEASDRPGSSGKGKQLRGSESPRPKSADLRPR